MCILPRYVFVYCFNIYWQTYSTSGPLDLVQFEINLGSSAKKHACSCSHVLVRSCCDCRKCGTKRACGDSFFGLQGDGEERRKELLSPSRSLQAWGWALGWYLWQSLGCCITLFWPRLGNMPWDPWQTRASSYPHHTGPIGNIYIYIYGIKCGNIPNPP